MEYVRGRISRFGSESGDRCRPMTRRAWARRCRRRLSAGHRHGVLHRRCEAAEHPRSIPMVAPDSPTSARPGLMDRPQLPPRVPRSERSTTMAPRSLQGTTRRCAFGSLLAGTDAVFFALTGRLPQRASPHLPPSPVAEGFRPGANSPRGSGVAGRDCGPDDRGAAGRPVPFRVMSRSRALADQTPGPKLTGDAGLGRGGLLPHVRRARSAGTRIVCGMRLPRARRRRGACAPPPSCLGDRAGGPGANGSTGFWSQGGA